MTKLYQDYKKFMVGPELEFMGDFGDYDIYSFENNFVIVYHENMPHWKTTNEENKHYYENYLTDEDVEKFKNLLGEYDEAEDTDERMEVRNQIEELFNF